MFRRKWAGVVGVFSLAVLLSQGQAPPEALAGDKKAPDAASLERTRTMVKMLDDLYKTAVVSITNKYVEDQANTPAAAVAKEVFQAMHQKGWHTARLIDATGKPKNKANVAKTPFEVKAVEEMKAGKSYYEEVAEKDGKPVLRAATVVPTVLRQCVVCHGKKEGTLLGVIVYEVPIK
ncbi:MAG TPA: DUF3365 domain-containing protein [Terriglobia bacterium]|nr:DUF3365 domain-containing protein [Terriglobia bacterium]